MERLKASRDARRAASKYSAAESHKQTDKYLSEFGQAWRELGGDSGEDAEAIHALQLTKDHAPRANEGGELMSAADTLSKSGLTYQSELPDHVVDGWLSGPVDELGPSHSRFCQQSLPYMRPSAAKAGGDCYQCCSPRTQCATLHVLPKRDWPPTECSMLKHRNRVRVQAHVLI